MILLTILVGRPARAQTIFQADGAAALGYHVTTQTPASSSRTYLDLRPALLLRFGSPRLVWQASYVFAGSLTLGGTEASSYSNRVGLALAAEPSPRAAMTAGASVTQGNTAFRLTQAAPEAGQPGFRDPGNPDLLEATLVQAFGWEASRDLRLRQGILASASAPRSAPDRGSASASASVGLDRVFSSDAVGGAYRCAFAQLRPLAEGAPAVRVVTNSLLGSWNHDFDWRWNAQAMAGVDLVTGLAGGHPTTAVPTGSLTARYLGGDSTASVAVTHASATDLQTGTQSLSDAVVLRGAVTFDRIRQRQLGASLGFQRARPLGEAIPSVAAGLGNALQGDVGATWGLSDAVLVTARYTVAYQFGRQATIPTSLVHVALLGLTVRYSTDRYLPPMPTLGGRVDGSDAVGFKGGDAGKE